jgi:hypothetical protein
VGAGMGARQAGKTVAMSQRPEKNKKKQNKKSKRGNPIFLVFLMF